VKWPCMSMEKCPQHMPLLGEAMARGLVSGIKGKERYLYSDGIYWALRLFWLNLDKRLC